MTLIHLLNTTENKPKIKQQQQTQNTIGKLKFFNKMNEK